MTGSWRVDRPGEQPEYFPNWLLALAHEKFLQLRGVQHCVAWHDLEATGPFQPEPFTEPIPERGLMAENRPEKPQEPISAPQTHELDPSYTDVTNGPQNATQPIHLEAS